MTAHAWPAGEPGLVELPDGRRVVGRGLRDTGGRPDVALVLSTLRPDVDAGRVDWVPWPDFGLPVRPASAREAVGRTHALAARFRVAVLCGHGSGRTGAVLAVMGCLSGVPAGSAVDWIRGAYRPDAVETPWQRWWTRRTAVLMTSGRSR